MVKQPKKPINPCVKLKISRMNSNMRRMFRSVSAQHGKHFALWLVQNKKMDGYFNSSWGWTHTRYYLAYSLDGIDQIEPELSYDERRSIY
jgi:hypothetical protein